MSITEDRLSSTQFSVCNRNGQLRQWMRSTHQQLINIYNALAAASLLRIAMVAANVVHRVKNSAHLRDGALGLGGQAMISLVALVLARALGAYGFGIVNICVGVLVLAVAVQNGIICQPLSIIGLALNGQSYKNLVRTSAVGQAVFTLLSVALLAVTSVITSSGPGCRIDSESTDSRTRVQTVLAIDPNHMSIRIAAA